MSDEDRKLIKDLRDVGSIQTTPRRAIIIKAADRLEQLTAAPKNSESLLDAMIRIKEHWNGSDTKDAMWNACNEMSEIASRAVADHKDQLIAAQEVPEGSVQVKVAVSVRHDGNWSASGWSVDQQTEDDICALLPDNDGSTEALYWLTAALAKPSSVIHEVTAQIESVEL